MGVRFRRIEHLIRLAGLFLGGIVLFYILRFFLVPDGFGTYGHFRAGALDDNAQRDLGYAGRAVCVDCHSDVADRRAGGPHEQVGCEGCHGPLARHALEDPEAHRPALPEPVELCLTCHQADAAKPSSFPQIDPQEHMEGASCGDCHDPHSPDKEPEP